VRWLALRSADCLNNLVLCNTAAQIGTVESWNTRIDAVLARGVPGISETTINRSEDGRFLAEHIPGSKFTELDAAHFSNIELPDAFSRNVLDFPSH